ncbi:hypothetical protein ACU3L3_07295 [Priestia endophytica]
MLRSFEFNGIAIIEESLEQAENVLREYFKENLEEQLSKGKEFNYDIVYTYFPVSEIAEEDIPYIHDYKRKGDIDEVASLPLSRAYKYESYIEYLNKEKGKIHRGRV